ncbi:hypothetical protein KR222_008311 [Zaprionus bogoriensis]|nr:hypothetical protein KR222_008311 [Zaprionus bogoriensis]
MLRNRSPHRCSGAFCLFFLTVYMLLVMPALAHSGNIETVKEELPLRELEPKLEEDGGVLSGNRAALTHFGGNRRNQRSFGYGPKVFQISRSKMPIELGLFLENEDGERPKRFDDYGHMRFGKRGGDEQFDDYGHMRFGR